MTRQNRKRLMDRKVVELFLQGKSTRAIMRQLHLGDRRVRHLRCMAEEYGYVGKNPPVPLPPYPEPLFPDGPDGRESKNSEANTQLLLRKDWIIERLAVGWHPITVFEELKLPISRSSFYRFLHRHKMRQIGDDARRRVVPEIIHRPGEALLLDWGKLRDVVDDVTHKKKTLWAFVGVLGYSRYTMVRLVWTNDTKTTLSAIESMLNEIGGVTERITSDNPKCFSLEASRYEPLLNPAFERMAGHYGIRIECLPPADPEKKGKVERLMPYIRRLYEAHGDEWHGLEESQTYIDHKLAVANERVHGTTRKKPLQELIQVEAHHLGKLPALGYELEESSEAKVRRDGHVRFDNKYYSLAETLIGCTVLLLATKSQVSIYHQGKLVEIHPRLSSDDPLISKSTKPHHLKPWERESQNKTLFRERAQKIGPDVERFVEGLIKQGDDFIDTRKIWGVLSLDKSFTTTEINEACRQVIELGTFSYRTVKSVLLMMRTIHEDFPLDDVQIKKPKNPQDQSHRFVRSLSDYEDVLKSVHELMP